MIWWWQFSWSDGLLPLFITRFGWSVKMRSMQDDEFWRMCVGSDISWQKPHSELMDSICGPLLFVMLWTHQILDLALKSPCRIVKAGSWFLILPKRFSRDKIKCSNSPGFWLGERYKVVTYPFFFPVTISHAKHAKTYITHLPCGNLIIVIDAYTSSFGITGVICSY